MRVLSCMFVLVLAAVVTFGQTKDVDPKDTSVFVGTWNFEKVESSSPAFDVHMKKRSQGQIMFVTQTGSALTVKFKGIDGSEAEGPTYYVDGRGETNTIGDKEDVEITTTKLNKGKLI